MARLKFFLPRGGNRRSADPPSFLVILLPFAPLGFFGSYVAFQIVSGALLALRSSTNAALPSGGLLAAVLICPASTINVIDGQAVFLVAALIVGGFGLIERRPSRRVGAGAADRLPTDVPQVQQR